MSKAEPAKDVSGIFLIVRREIRKSVAFHGNRSDAMA